MPDELWEIDTVFPSSRAPIQPSRERAMPRNSKPYDYETLKCEKNGHILTITMNRPEQLNAANLVMNEEFGRIWDEVHRDNEVRVVILTGAGRAFCAGGDVGRMAKSEENTLVDRWVHSINTNRLNIMRQLECNKPIIAKVNGPAVGLGASLALACDIVFIADDAKIGDTHVKVGLVAGDGGSALWPWLVGFHRAKEYLFGCDLMLGTEAARIGLVNYAYPKDQLDAKVQEFAEKLANQPPLALQWTKAATNSQLRAMVGVNMDVSLSMEHMSQSTEDHREASRAFKEKRKPTLKGR